MGFKCKDVSKITKFKEMLDGRVKTINPLIFSSLLYKRENTLMLFGDAKESLNKIAGLLN